MPDHFTAKCQIGPEEAEGMSPVSAAALISKLPSGSGSFLF